MSKWKINPNFFALLLVASLFAEWKYMAILAFLVFVLWNENEKLRKLAIQVVAISSACALFSLLWTAISNGFSVVDSAANLLNSIIKLFDDTYTRPEWVITLLAILDKVEALIANLVSLAIYFAKFSFIVAIISNELPNKGIFSKISEYLNKFSSFVDKKLYDLVSTNPAGPVVQNTQPTVNQTNEQNLNN